MDTAPAPLVTIAVMLPPVADSPVPPAHPHAPLRLGAWRRRPVRAYGTGGEARMASFTIEVPA